MAPALRIAPVSMAGAELQGIRRFVLGKEKWAGTDKPRVLDKGVGFFLLCGVRASLPWSVLTTPFL